MGSSNRHQSRNSQPYQDTRPQAPQETAPAPVVVFATSEAQASVTGPLRDRYENAVTFASAEWEQAGKCQADIDEWAREIAERQQWIERRTLDMQQHMVHGQQACDVANPAAELLAFAGVHVERISAPVISSAPPSIQPADRRVHPLDTSRPLPDPVAEPKAGVVDPSPTGVQSPMDNPPAGHCILCGQSVWRTARTETSPNGVTHGWGAICDPNADVREYADLGEGREVAS